MSGHSAKNYQNILHLKLKPPAKYLPLKYSHDSQNISEKIDWIDKIKWNLLEGVFLLYVVYKRAAQQQYGFAEKVAY